MVHVFMVYQMATLVGFARRRDASACLPRPPLEKAPPTQPSCQILDARPNILHCHRSRRRHLSGSVVTITARRRRRQQRRWNFGSFRWWLTAKEVETGRECPSSILSQLGQFCAMLAWHCHSPLVRTPCPVSDCLPLSTLNGLRLSLAAAAGSGIPGRSHLADSQPPLALAPK
mmetsp:Transcript_37239/g.105063  ORF Transcript_37239/g.105063 Transcript_37239/m.105063 type:complete len:173 (-) Transcript_37239:230-748(-)